MYDAASKYCKTYNKIAILPKDCLTSLKIDICNTVHKNKIACSSKLWHLRLGHIPMNQIKVLDPSLIYDTDSSFCTICPLAKQTGLAFFSSITRSSKPLKLIHVDMWGPYRFKTRQLHNGFLTIIDDYNRFTFTFLITHKSEYPTLIKQFVLLVEHQFDAKVKIIRSDNAKEITEGAALLFYKHHGIFLQTNCRDTPQQNGVVDRKHKHLLEVAIALSFQSKLPQSFWGDCLQCATFLINRTPTPTLNGLTPYEQLYQKLPDYLSLELLGA